MTGPQTLVHLQLRESPPMLITDPHMLLKRRIDLKISLRELAKECDCSHTTITKHENMVIPTIPEDRARKWAKALRLPMASAFRIDDDFAAIEASFHSGMAESA